MYETVPGVNPSAVSRVAPSTRAIPKSVSFAVPLESTMMFNGLTSR